MPRLVKSVGKKFCPPLGDSGLIRRQRGPADKRCRLVRCVNVRQGHLNPSKSSSRDGALCTALVQIPVGVVPSGAFGHPFAGPGGLSVQASLYIAKQKSYWHGACFLFS